VFLQLKVAALSFLDFRVLLLAGILFGGNLPAQAKPNLAAINLPPGFAIEIWSDAVPNARSLALGDKDTVFVSSRRDGRVYALAPQENGPPVVYTLAKNLRMPSKSQLFVGLKKPGKTVFANRGSRGGSPSSGLARR
jgi:hypothetical protein